jgi:chromosome segregation ATPase
MTVQSTNNYLFTMILSVMLSSISPSLAATSGSSTASAADVQQEAKDLMQALKGYTVKQRDEAVRKTKAALDNLDQRIDALENRIDNNWDKMNNTARAKARASLKALRKQRTEVAEWYGSLKSSTADAWKHIKQGFSDAYMDLHEAWVKSEKEFVSDK